MTTAVEIREPGIAAVQDLGRIGFTRYGVPVGGALDQYSARVANALVGNAQHARLVETTAMDFGFVPEGDVLIAVTGAVATVTLDGVQAPMWRPVAVPAGTHVSVSRIRVGYRCYVAVRGELAADEVMGSCTPDAGLGIGGMLQRGERLPLRSGFAMFDHPYLRHPLLRPDVTAHRLGSPWTIDVTDGPDTAAFDGWTEAFYRAGYTVSERSNHVGLRMTGDLPEPSYDTELLSRGVAVGAVEVTPSTELLVLLRGRGVTAGYPVVAVATSTAQSLLGQVRPGDEVRFRRRSVDEAVTAYRAERSAVDQLETRMRALFQQLRIG